MRPIMTNAERQRNNRLKELHAKKSHTHTEQITSTRPTRLTQEQMDLVNDLREQGMSREDAVDKVLNDKDEKPEPRCIKRNKHIFIDMKIEEYFESQRVNELYRIEYLLQRQR